MFQIFRCTSSVFRFGSSVSVLSIIGNIGKTDGYKINVVIAYLRWLNSFVKRKFYL